MAEKCARVGEEISDSVHAIDLEAHSLAYDPSDQCHPCSRAGLVICIHKYQSVPSPNGSCSRNGFTSFTSSVTRPGDNRHLSSEVPERRTGLTEQVERQASRPGMWTTLKPSSRLVQKRAPRSPSIR